MNGRAFGLVEHFGLDEGFIYIFAHFSAEGVQFADKVAFGAATYVGVAGHQSDAVYADCKHDCLQAQAGMPVMLRSLRGRRLLL